MCIRDRAGFLAKKATLADLRQLRDSGHEQGFSSEVWAEMAAMGWAGIAIAEEFGGLGYGYTGLGLVLEQAGRNLSSSPLPVSYTHLRAHETVLDLVCRLLLEKNKTTQQNAISTEYREQ